LKKIILLLILLAGCASTPQPVRAIKEFTPEIKIQSDRNSADVPLEIKWVKWKSSVFASAINSRPVFIYFYDDLPDSKEMNYNMSDPEVVRFINDNFKPYKFHARNKAAQQIANILKLQKEKPPFVLIAMPNIINVKFMEFPGPLEKEDILAIPFLP